MRVIIFDNTDRPDLGYRSPTLRILDDQSAIVLQGQVLADDVLEVGRKLAAGCGVELEYHGPAKTARAEVAAAPSSPLATVDPPAKYRVQGPNEVPAGFLF